MTGNPADLEHLKYDVTNLVHYVRQGARVLVIGVGGGRDVLSAVLFGQRSVLGVEINQDIIGTVNASSEGSPGTWTVCRRFASSMMKRAATSPGRRSGFDIIQISLIDTWAATSAGAFVLTENSLYTAEAWKLFLDRLSPNGILAVSRYHFRSRPDETYRLTSLAHAALTRAGVTDPRPHIVIVKQIDASGRTPVASRRCSSAGRVLRPGPRHHRGGGAEDAVRGRAESPVFRDDTFTTLASADDPRRFLASFPSTSRRHRRQARSSFTRFVSGTCSIGRSRDRSSITST